MTTDHTTDATPTLRISTNGPDVSSGDVTIVVAGDLDLDGAAELEATIEHGVDLACERAGQVMLDLRDVAFIDSTGLRALLAGRVEADRRGVHLSTTGLSAAARRLLELTDTLERLRAGVTPA
ncbi:MAG: STAS domain-containing protein [Acidimicrobiales bacterium]|nr:STAS domain-containing protein [Acidimicrobiales bacterium]MCB9394256.1 STAS domain-containing protein [Acidimicrobiaceae bacterium]